MIKYHQEYNKSGTGLAYQISVYVMMRSLVEKTGLKWAVDSNSLKALKNTFTDLNLNVLDNDEDTYDHLTFDDEYGFNNIAEAISDNCEIYLYPTPANFVATGDNGDLFLKVKQELKFRQDIFDKCKAFRDKFDSEVIGLHIRRGDFATIDSGMFLCGNDYYENALAKLPEDLPVLIFTNDKDSVISDNELIANNPERFTFITDLFNDNELISCDVGQEMDKLVDISGTCRFDYKNALIEIARTRLDGVVTYSQIIDEVAQVAKELHPKYIEKLKTNSYNYSYDLCLLTMCDYVVMANSTFSLWGAELGNPKKVIYPMYWIQGHSEDTFIKTDLDGYDQTRDMGSHIIDRPHYIGVENPDPRSFTVVR